MPKTLVQFELILRLLGRQIAIERRLQILVGLLLDIGGVLQPLNEFVLLLFQLCNARLDLHTSSIFFQNAIYQSVSLLLPFVLQFLNQIRLFADIQIHNCNLRFISAPPPAFSAAGSCP